MFKKKKCTYSELKWIWFKKRLYNYFVNVTFIEGSCYSDICCEKTVNIIEYHKWEDIICHCDYFTGGRITEFLLPKLSKSNTKDAFNTFFKARSYYIKGIKKENQISKIKVEFSSKLKFEAIEYKREIKQQEKFKEIMGDINEG